MQLSGIPFYCCSLAYAIDYKLSSVVDAAKLSTWSGAIYIMLQRRKAPI